MESDCLTIRQAAQRLGLQESTLRKWILQQRIGIVRFGRSVRLRATDIDKMIIKGYRAPLEKL